MNVVFAAGGTGGHINPALAIADKLRDVFPGTKILFIGTPDGLEAKLVKKAGYDFAGVEMSGFQRKLTVRNVGRNVKGAYQYMAAGGKIRKIFASFGPDLVIGTGGYVTGTVVKQAVKSGIKTALHESNSLPGVSVKMLADKVDIVMLGNKDAEKHLKDFKKCVVTGNPLRSNIPIESKQAARERLGLPDRFTILSAGGSQGAMKINEAVVGLLAWEQKKGGINHIHGYGRHGRDTFMQALSEAGVDAAKEGFIIKEYIDNMYTCMCASDLIITRAGAMTLTEIMAVGRPSVLIPYPYAAENHQYYNALTLQNENAGRIIEDKELSKAKLIDLVSGLEKDSARLELMSENAARLAVKDAAGNILSEIIDLMGLIDR